MTRRSTLPLLSLRPAARRHLLLVGLLGPLGLAACASDGPAAIPGLSDMLSDAEHREYIDRQQARAEALNAPKEREELGYEQLLAEGDRFRVAGNAARAYLHYTKAQKLAPEGDTTPQRRIAYLAIREAPADARRLFAELLQADPTDADLLYGKAFAELRSGQVRAARSTLDLAVAVAPSHAPAHRLLGVVCDRMDQREAAQHHYREALTLEPNDLETLNNLGVSLLMSEEYTASAQALGKAVGLGSTDPATLTNLGLALGFLGRHEAALAAFRRAGSAGDAYNNLGYVLAIQGDIEGARAYYERALLANDTDETRVIRNLMRLEGAEPGAPERMEQLLLPTPAAPAPPASPAPLDFESDAAPEPLPGDVPESDPWTTDPGWIAGADEAATGTAN